MPHESSTISSFETSRTKAIEVQGLTKVYGALRAVDDIRFTVDRGEIFGFLGPNGAGKTTTIKMLITISSATAGRISVFDVDAHREPLKVRQMLGYVPQEVSVDGYLTAYENLLIYSKLYFIPKRERQRRIREALEYMDLSDRANELVNHFSGGMMRRLEIAQVLVNRPKILFLDEPTIGLDPQAKRAVWNYVKRLNKEFGTTVFMTTHDMTEADVLCNRLAIINRGRIVVTGEPEKLKHSVGFDTISLRISTENLPNLESLKSSGITYSGESNGQLNLSAENGEKAVPIVLDELRRNNAKVESVSVSKPTLDDVFLKYAGVRMSSEEQTAQQYIQTRQARRSFRRLSQ